MCNAYRHPAGCQCGFGPPYPDVDVSIRKLTRRGDRQSSRVAELDLSFHIPKAIFFHLVDKVGKKRVLETTAEALQQLADNRFGKGNIKVAPIYIKKSSIIVSIVLFTLGAAYVFFKDYKAIRDGVTAFVEDIKCASSKLNRVVRKKYLREEQRSLIKKSRDRTKKDQVLNESEPAS